MPGKRTLRTSDNSQVIFEINPQQAEIINALLATGFWGASPRDVCRRLLDEQFRIYHTILTPIPIAHARQPK